MGYFYVLVTVALTCAGPLLMKWQLCSAGPVPTELDAKLLFLVMQCFRPAVARSYLGALSWMAALAKLPISTAYPIMSLSYVVVMLCGVLLFDEAVSMPKVIGICLILCGVWKGARN